MNWHQDEATARAAVQFPFPIHSPQPARQPPGLNFNPTTWNRRTLARSWPSGPLRSDPDRIIHLFRQEHYLEALAMIFQWGGMRSQAAVYGDRDLHDIELALRQCDRSIRDTDESRDAWLILTGGRPEHLGWSAVMASKTLHFLGRACGREDQNPPVPRDGAVSLGYAWPGWIAHVPPSQRPQSWEGDTFEAYNRYMTAILVWAEQRRWTTTQIETTKFDERPVR